MLAAGTITPDTYKVACGARGQAAMGLLLLVGLYRLLGVVVIAEDVFFSIACYS